MDYPTNPFLSVKSVANKIPAAPSNFVFLFTP